jgi:hypothetical protein
MPVARLMVTLVHEMSRRGVAMIYIGTGQRVATVEQI